MGQEPYERKIWTHPEMDSIVTTALTTVAGGVAGLVAGAAVCVLESKGVSFDPLYAQRSLGSYLVAASASGGLLGVVVGAWRPRK